MTLEGIFNIKDAIFKLTHPNLQKPVSSVETPKEATARRTAEAEESGQFDHNPTKRLEDALSIWQANLDNAKTEKDRQYAQEVIDGLKKELSKG